MKKSLKNWLLLNSSKLHKKQNKRILVLLLFFISDNFFSQVNFVNNPSFEDKYTCNINFNEIYKAKYWCGIDSTKPLCGGDYYNSCSTNINTSVPSNVFSYQYARTGKAYAICGSFYCPTPACSPTNQRAYLKNRLRSNLITGVKYCVKMHVNLINKCKYGIDALSIYLADITIDTISTCTIPLTYLTPQISNPSGNIISDTLNWIEVSGTFTANGSEKYLVIGNFFPNSSVNTTTVNSSQPGWSTYNIDDVSIIDYNLPAYAGPDKNINLGDSAFIGRPPEIGLDCTWTTGTVTVGDSAGIWVKPTSLGTFSYVVTQNICGNIKTDTVNVNISSGINENTAFAQSIGIYPQPAKDLVNISLSYFYDPTIEIKITDVTGKIIRSESLVVRNGKAQIETSEFPIGVYTLQIISKNQIAQKRLVVTK
jgi:hypothetical protein